ncbi:cell division septation protein DedD [Actinoalloteichus hoggarensis]|uniref:Uncharacterized protein n=1 Tax=Actinoalloteichus hoggarensis TaxID=1470176 RepID=A0A221WBN0_9PSEU|nr:hypothetical protein [Actinoalloteichus hoggarensis]ASO22687.1 hypothetical protein AHOG_25410 [Actinoalloteichus hoggarensis]MBB5924170.1 cell division septation protein DedD [Actinoalloteichus hoggarensis]
MPKRTLIIIAAAVIGLAYLVDRQEPSEADDAPRAPLFGTPCDFEVIDAAVPVHAGPAANHPVIGELTSGMVIGAHQVEQEGYRQLGRDRWVPAGALRHISGELCR